MNHRSFYRPGAFISLHITGFYLVLAVFLLSPSLAFGDMRQYIPRILDYNGALEINGLYQSDKDVGENPSLDKHILFTEDLDLSANGFIYHPKLIMFNLSTKLGLVHTNQANFGATSTWAHSLWTDYGLSAIVLPSHPYHLTLFTDRLSPSKEISGPDTSLASVIYRSGAFFTYKKKPLFVDLDYTRTSVTTTEMANVNTSVSNSYSFSTTYLKQWTKERTLDLSVYGQYTNSSSSTDIQTSNKTAGLTGLAHYDFFNLDSFFNYRANDQLTPDVHFNSDAISWRQVVRVPLPLRFSANASYGLNKESSLSGSAVTDESKITNNMKEASFSLTQQLFDSLDSGYNLGYTSQNSLTGTSSALTNTFSETYSKIIPWGHLVLGAHFGHSNVQRTGTIGLPDQPYLGLPFPGTPPLVIPNVDVEPSSITVSVKSPLPPFEIVFLQKNINYIVDVGPTGLYQVNIIFLPPGFPASGTFDFFLSYLLTSGTVKIDSSTVSFNGQATLFDRLLSIYGSHASFTNNVTGDAAGQAESNVTNLVGIRAEKWGGGLTLEYQTIKGNDQPSNTSRAQLDYRTGFEPDIKLYTSSSYQRIEYPQGSLISPGIAFNDQSFQAQVGATKSFFRDVMFLSLGGNYMMRSGLVDSRSYGLSSSLNMSIGKTYLNLGIDVTSTETKALGLTEKRVFQYAYFKLRRVLF